MVVSRSSTALLAAGCLLGSAETLYVDCLQGNDAALGTSSQSAWRTLLPVNRKVFQSGDRILLKSGCSWTGQLAPRGSGAEGRPIILDQYGAGPKPAIHGNGGVEDAVHLYNVEYWELRNLEVTNRGRSAKFRRGVHIELNNFGEARHIYLQNLVVHDVNGDLSRKENGGIIWTNGGAIRSRFIDMRIEGCQVYRVDRSGIVARSSYWRRYLWYPSLNVVIRNNRVDDVGGDGITPWACDGALIERNVVSNCNRRASGYNAGIWPWSCDNTLVQYNEVFQVRGTRDGQGFDSDGNCRNTVIQYNYSHDNEGGFVLICEDGSHSRRVSAGNVGTIVRYNVSENDGTRTFHIGGPVKNARIHNNTVYIGPGRDVQLVIAGQWSGRPEDIRFDSNIFYAAGTGRYGSIIRKFEDGTHAIMQGLPGVTFEKNVFFGNHIWRPPDALALLVDPLFEGVGTGLNRYRLKPGSPAQDRGMPSIPPDREHPPVR